MGQPVQMSHTEPRLDDDVDGLDEEDYDDEVVPGELERADESELQASVAR